MKLYPDRSYKFRPSNRLTKKHAWMSSINAFYYVRSIPLTVKVHTQKSFCMLYLLHKCTEWMNEHAEVSNKLELCKPITDQFKGRYNPFMKLGFDPQGNIDTNAHNYPHVTIQDHLHWLQYTDTFDRIARLTRYKLKVEKLIDIYTQLMARLIRLFVEANHAKDYKTRIYISKDVILPLRNYYTNEPIFLKHHVDITEQVNQWSLPIMYYKKRKKKRKHAALSTTALPSQATR